MTWITVFTIDLSSPADLKGELWGSGPPPTPFQALKFNFFLPHISTQNMLDLPPPNEIYLYHFSLMLYVFLTQPIILPYVTTCMLLYSVILYKHTLYEL